MHIEHIAIWTADIERLRAFYEAHFGARAGKRYVNSAKQFESYFLQFESGARLEIMSKPTVLPGNASPAALERGGYAHLAMALGSRECVVEKTAHLVAAGYAVLDGPRVTGDGYFESVILDPDGNRIELTA
jgi:lactoylglutathione lyase